MHQLRRRQCRCGSVGDLQRKQFRESLLQRLRIHGEKRIHLTGQCKTEKRILAVSAICHRLTDPGLQRRQRIRTGAVCLHVLVPAFGETDPAGTHRSGCTFLGNLRDDRTLGTGFIGRSSLQASAVYADGLLPPIDGGSVVNMSQRRIIRTEGGNFPVAERSVAGKRRGSIPVGAQQIDPMRILHLLPAER